MKEPLLTDEAKNDLAEIWAVIADVRDERTANRMHQKILASCRSKAQFPETVRLREEISPGLRNIVLRCVLTWRSFVLSRTPSSFFASSTDAATLSKL